MSNKPTFITKTLEKRKKDHQFRSLRRLQPQSGSRVTDGKNSYINFSSNDYLGLAAHPSVADKAKTYLEKYGNGSGASRLITGNFDIHEELEETIAHTLSREAALLFNSGFQANSTILATITDRHSLILADKLSHNSLLQGSLNSRATFQRFKHNDLEHLENLLTKTRGKKYNRIWIVTETVFSMDGDRSPINEIAQLAEQYNAHLFADDAHAVGVWGSNGVGLAKDIVQADILLGTCGKGLGSFGAYVACSKQMKDYLINYCPGFIYTTALPPAVIGATQAAMELIPGMNAERKVFHQRIREFRASLQAIGFDTGPSSTQIIPIIIGDEEKTLSLSNYLEQKGFLATAIRPPTVPDQSSRLRITLTMQHTENQLQQLITTLSNWKNA